MLWGLTPAVRRPDSRQWTDRPEALRCWLELIEAELSKFFFDPIADPCPDYFHNGVGWIALLKPFSTAPFGSSKERAT
jgi:hypothetical protein